MHINLMSVNIYKAEKNQKLVMLMTLLSIKFDAEVTSMNFESRTLRKLILFLITTYSGPVFSFAMTISGSPSLYITHCSQTHNALTVESYSAAKPTTD